eukprot:3475244-Ditylum_brightwellii.AAC.1
MFILPPLKKEVKTTKVRSSKIKSEVTPKKRGQPPKKKGEESESDKDKDLEAEDSSVEDEEPTPKK